MKAALPFTEADRISPGSFADLKRRVAGRLEQGFYSMHCGYGLRRDLCRPFDRPRARIPIYVRPLETSDLDFLLPAGGDLPAAEEQQIRWRRHFYKKVPRGCYVAVDRRINMPCYMQWLVGSKDNDLLKYFKCFPRLADEEALMEQAYTIPSHRGLGIMSAAMAEIAERALDFGARYTVTFVPEDGAASMKACRRAGFAPYTFHQRIQIGYGAVVLNFFKPIAKS